MADLRVLGRNSFTTRPLGTLCSDPCLWRVLVAGPVFWLVLGFFGFSDFKWSKILAGGWQLLLFAGLDPLLEEWLFRGLLQPLLLRYPFGRRVVLPFGVTAANFLTSVLFVVLHLFTHPPLWAFLILVPSLIFGVFRDRYQSVIPPVFLHSFYNFGYFVLFLPL